ncbi:MAG: ATP-binding protein [bacterium]
MILFPQNTISLISLVLFFFFLQGGVFFLYFYLRVSRRVGIFTREHLYFSLMSFAQALYSFGAWQLYSTASYEAGKVWSRLQWGSAVLIFVFFVHFSLSYLKVKFRWVRFTVDVPAPVFLFVTFFGPTFIEGTPHPKDFNLFGHFYRILESDTGPWADFTALWLGIHILVLFVAWFYYLGRRIKDRTAAVVGLSCFVLAAFHEMFVGLGLYAGPYVLEYGFFIFAVAFYFQLFFDFFEIYRQNLHRTLELNRLHEESRFFINMVTHDLRAPLLSIEGFSTLLQEDSGKYGAEQKQDYLRRISKNAHLLLQRITDLKNFVNIGRALEPYEKIAVEELIGEILKNYELSLKKFRVRVSVSPEAKTVFFPRQRLHDVLMNLVGNAIKFCEGVESPELNVEVKDDPQAVLFLVEDNGPGIPPAHHEKIFDLFYRLRPERPGSGIGLAAVKRILTQGKGKVWVESEEGKGARFFFTLPHRK